MVNIQTYKFTDAFFIRYYFVIYYLYMMSVNVLIPKGGIYGIIVNAFMLVFLVYSTIKNYHFCRKFEFIYLYILFYFVLILLQSSNYLYSYTNLIKYSIGLLCLPLGFSIISSTYKFREFLKTGVILVGMYIIYIVLANIFNFGDFYGYRAEGSLQIGNIFSDGLYLNVYVITSLFLLLAFFPKHRWLILILLSICAIITVVNMKRTVIAVLLLGFVSFIGILFVNSKKDQLKFIYKYLKGLLLLLLCFAPFFAGYFFANLDQRSNRFDDEYEVNEEGRVRELEIIAAETFNSTNIKTILFGKETLNLVGTYAEGKFGGRNIHGDYAKIIHGTGVIGVMIWLLVYLYLVVYIVRLSRGINHSNNTLSRYLIALFYSYLLIYVVSMFSGVIPCVLSSSYLYASLGGILRLFYNKKMITSFIKL